MDKNYSLTLTNIFVLLVFLELARWAMWFITHYFGVSHRYDFPAAIVLIASLNTKVLLYIRYPQPH